MTPADEAPERFLVRYSPLLGRNVRAGTWDDLRISTFALIEEAILSDLDPLVVSRLVAYCIEECLVCYPLMKQWQQDVRSLLVERTGDQASVEAYEADLVALLANSDGSPYESARQWVEFKDTMNEIVDLAYRNEASAAAELVPAAVDRWRVVSGREADWAHGLMSHAVERLGDEVMVDIWDKALFPLFEWRYGKFDVATKDYTTEILPDLLYVALEAERTWLSTPMRDGAPLTLREFDDRWEMEFDPCGTGGRAMRGEAAEGTPSRMAPPYEFAVIEGAHDFTDGMAGMCTYCNHCQAVMEHWPMDRFGYPLRVVEPPLVDRSRTPMDGDVKCRWTMYKDPTTVPVEIYTRAGREKPAGVGSSRDVTSVDVGDTPTILDAGPGIRSFRSDR